MHKHKSLSVQYFIVYYKSYSYADAMFFSILKRKKNLELSLHVLFVLNLKFMKECFTFSVVKGVTFVITREKHHLQVRVQNCND